MKKGFSIFLIILSIFALVGVAGGAYYLGTRSSSSSTIIPFTKLPQTSPTSQIPDQIKTEPLFSGAVKKISKNLNLFKITDIDKENGIPDSIVYYEAGIFLRGEFKGYTRILAIRPSEGPGPSLQFILATKDFNTYVLDDPTNKTDNYPETDWDNPYMYIDKSKVIKTVTLDTDHPQTISTAKPFKLIRQDSILSEYKKTGEKDKNGNDIYLEMPLTKFEASSLLISSLSHLSLYAGETDWGNGEGYSDKEKQDLETRNKYLNTTTLVHGSDSTGLSYSYIVSTEKEINTYLNSLATNEQKNIEYKKQVALFNEKKLSDYPEYPKLASFPGLRLNKSSAGLPDAFYSTYESAFPGACGGTQSTYIVDGLEEADLDALSSSSEYPLFVLNDIKHPLYRLAYSTKTDQGEESFKSVNDNKSMPSFSEYVERHPLLFFKDAWGRWGVVGEFDLQLMGGCGKPVIYLYPEKQTEVRLSFVSPVALNTNIPTYNNGWFVSASPNGILTDLQSFHTDCSKIDSSHAGSEYAAAACKNNTYPYIYWSGKSVENSYPQVKGGWIVEKENLNSFMQNKLSAMGLTEKESRDMITYWVPKMKEKNGLYYRISFLQTKDLNTFIPMHVNPQPDSIVRVFLDWKALSSKPMVTPIPQQLEKMERNGFVLVEWGGLL